MINNQKCLPAISTMKEFERFLKSSFEWCIVQDFHISLVEGMISSAHQQNKKVLIHLDLIKGVTADEAGAEYICQKFKADGIISTKAKVIEATKRSKKVAIQRIFLIDSRSLEKGINQLLVTQPNYVEVLPGIASSILPMMKEKLGLPLISGGLVKDVETVKECLSNGASLVSIGSLALAEDIEENL